MQMTLTYNNSVRATGDAGSVVPTRSAPSDG